VWLLDLPIVLASSTGSISLVFSFPRESISSACFYWKADYKFHFWGHKICILSIQKLQVLECKGKRQRSHIPPLHRYLCCWTGNLFIFSTSSTSSRTRHLSAQGGEYSTALGEAQLLIRPRGWPISRIIHFCSIHFFCVLPNWPEVIVTDILLTCRSLF